jgi:hypothetical protein
MRVPELAVALPDDWLQSVPASSACLAREVCRRLVVALEGKGFSWQFDRSEDAACASSEIMFDRSEDAACASSEIMLERWCSEHVEYIGIAFEPDWTQRFAISFGRFALVDPCRIDRSGYLASARDGTDRWWGKPEWVPLNVWTASRASLTVAAACDELPQVIAFIEGGAAGASIRV